MVCAFSESYRVGPVDVHLMVRSELPNYKEKNGVRIADFNYIMNEKVKMIDEILNKPALNNRVIISEEADKHLDDLNRLIIKFNCIDEK